MSLKQLPRKKIPFALMIMGGLALVVGLILVNHPTPALANSNDLANFEGQYTGAVGTTIDTCTLCHTNNIPSLNPFGSAYSSNGRSGSALAAIEGLDSDGDGFSNIEEINAATFPGDPNSAPAGSPTSTPTTEPPTMVPSETPTTVVTLPTEGPTPTETMVPTETSTSEVTPSATVVGTPHVTKTPKPTKTVGPTKTQRPTKTTGPTGQPTPCVGDDDGEDGENGQEGSVVITVAYRVLGVNAPVASDDDERENCRPSGGGGGDDGGKGGGGGSGRGGDDGGKGGGEGGGRGGDDGGDSSNSESLVPSNSILAMLNSLFSLQ